MMQRTYTLADLAVRVVAPAECGLFENGSDEPEFRGHDRNYPSNSGSCPPEFPALVAYMQTAPEVNPNRPLHIETDGDTAYHFLMHGVDCRVDEATAAAHITLAPDASVFHFVLRMLFSEMLLIRGGGVFHAAGLVRGGRGFIFAGPHGAGKTTVAGCPGHSVADDDTAVVRRDTEGVFQLYPTPAWMKDSPAQRGEPALPAPLAACYILSHASYGARSFATQDTPGQRVHALFQNLRYVLPRAHTLAAAQSFLHALQDSVFTATFNFSLQDKERLWHVIEQSPGREI